MIARVAVGAAVALLAVPGLAAGSPREIAQDLADGKLDGTYSASELRGFLNDATVQGYGNPVVTANPPTAGVAGEQSPTQGQAGVGAVAGARTLPFTGLDIGLMVAGGLVLLALGAGMRRLARDHG
jgi:hypothetical protein